MSLTESQGPCFSMFVVSLSVQLPPVQTILATLYGPFIASDIITIDTRMISQMIRSAYVS